MSAVFSFLGETDKHMTCAHCDLATDRSALRAEVDTTGYDLLTLLLPSTPDMNFT